ncbi:hypothetical protein HPB52_021669 [Rhipicephalus sanguineus]|uniref:Uncharacterized protein n=1 Tax=Rhipicephalus sanguineus TaxID=34632 RepID=A0A9D4Q2U9_RHISA|nr:hypothetical protein HPB52_021669 [Rhipicephalus sanguineus]
MLRKAQTRSSEGERWLRGIVKTTTGFRMVTIQTATGELQRHLDQVRLRQSPAEETKPSPKKETASLQGTASVPT